MTEETTMKKKLLVAAVVGAVAAPGASLAAIDDAGMKYISASEGLQGSIRIRLIDDTDGKNRGVQTAYSSSRLIYVGDADLGGGLAATYLFEFRPDGGNGSDLHTENVDAGLRGPFGWIRAGRIESVSSAILPSADLTADVGSTGEKLAGDYDNGIRWTSPDINGLMLGLSAMMVDRVVETTTYPVVGTDASPVTATKNIDDDTIDQFDLAAVYSLPQGIKLGASYVKVAGDPDDPDDDSDNDYGDVDGFRLGVSYGQDNWSVAYNFHSYDGDNARSFIGSPDGGFSDEQLATGAGVAAVDAGNVAPANARVFDVNRHKDTEYTEHALGANVQLGKIGLAVNYLLSNLENSSYDSAPITSAGAVSDTIQGLDYEVSQFAFDAAYSLGSRARLIAAFKSVDKDDHPVSGAEGGDEDTYYLLYRVDF